MNQTNIPYEEHLQVLHNSTMFHMSLGSKELFHSNFLHWISIVNWGAFLQIMHDLAGLKKDEVFWWEKENVWDCHEKLYHPDNNNIEVRREFHNFDLSIYILDSEKEPDVSPCSEDNNSEENKGKWIPVLILENKMKSLPYEEQLERYTQKAFDEWRTVEKIKTEARNSQGKVLENRYGITFILLSLMETTLDNYGFSKEKVSTNPKYTIKLTSEWKHKTYNELLESIDRTKTMPGWDTKRSLDQLIVDDYFKFVKALYALSSRYWTIKPEESYRLQISPWGIENSKEKRNEIEEYKKLRIHDIHEKLLYNQLLSLLESKLRNNNLSFCRYSKEAIQEQVKKDSKDPIRLFTNSSYAHGIGIFEVQYILSESFIPEEGHKELFKLIIQVQGDRYCHMVVYDNIVIVDDTNKKNLKVNNEVLEPVWKDQTCLIQDLSKSINQYISISGSTAKFPIDGQAKGSNPSFGKYGENLIYQWVEIPEGKSINNVINAIINDVCSIKGWFNSKKSHPDF